MLLDWQRFRKGHNGRRYDSLKNKRQTRWFAVVMMLARALGMITIILRISPSPRLRLPNVASGLITGLKPLLRSVYLRTQDWSFFEKIKLVKTGMSTGQAMQILGKPDDVWTRIDRGMILNSNVYSNWCYGSKKHLDFPTLGTVEFNDIGIVFRTTRGEGTLYKLNSLDESQLREHMQLLSTAPTFSGCSFDPFCLVMMVKTFQGLGQEKTLAVFREYDRVSRARALRAYGGTQYKIDLVIHTTGGQQRFS